MPLHPAEAVWVVQLGIVIAVFLSAGAAVSYALWWLRRRSDSVGLRQCTFCWYPRSAIASQCPECGRSKRHRLPALGSAVLSTGLVCGAQVVCLMVGTPPVHHPFVLGLALLASGTLTIGVGVATCLVSPSLLPRDALRLQAGIGLGGAAAGCLLMRELASADHPLGFGVLLLAFLPMMAFGLTCGVVVGACLIALRDACASVR